MPDLSAIVILVFLKGQYSKCPKETTPRVKRLISVLFVLPKVVLRMEESYWLQLTVQFWNSLTEGLSLKQFESSNFFYLFIFFKSNRRSNGLYCFFSHGFTQS